MGEAEERKAEDESALPRLLGEWHLYTSARNTSYHTMRDSKKREADGRTDVQHRKPTKPLP